MDMLWITPARKESTFTDRLNQKLPNLLSNLNFLAALKEINDERKVIKLKDFKQNKHLKQAISQKSKYLKTHFSKGTFQFVWQARHLHSHYLIIIVI